MSTSHPHIEPSDGSEFPDVPPPASELVDDVIKLLSWSQLMVVPFGATILFVSVVFFKQYVWQAYAGIVLLYVSDFIVRAAIRRLRKIEKRLTMEEGKKSVPPVDGPPRKPRIIK